MLLAAAARRDLVRGRWAYARQLYQELYPRPFRKQPRTRADRKRSRQNAMATNFALIYGYGVDI